MSPSDVADVPAILWFDTFENCHSITPQGIFFHGWPDGGPLLEQEEVVVQGFRNMKDEVRKVLREQQKREEQKRGRQRH